MRKHPFNVYFMDMDKALGLPNAAAIINNNVWTVVRHLRIPVTFHFDDPAFSPGFPDFQQYAEDTGLKAMPSRLVAYGIVFEPDGNGGIRQRTFRGLEHLLEGVPVVISTLRDYGVIAPSLQNHGSHIPRPDSDIAALFDQVTEYDRMLEIRERKYEMPLVLPTLNETREREQREKEARGQASGGVQSTTTALTTS